MSFADSPLYVSDTDQLPPKLYRLVEDHRRPTDSRYGLIHKEDDGYGHKLIVTDPLLYRAFLRELENDNQQVKIAVDTYLNPESVAYSERNLKIIGVRSFDLAEIPQSILQSIEFIGSQVMHDRLHSPVLGAKER